MTHFDPLIEILNGQVGVLGGSTPFMKLYFENLHSLMPYKIFLEKLPVFHLFFQFFCQKSDKSSNSDYYESLYNSVAQKL